VVNFGPSLTLAREKKGVGGTGARGGERGMGPSKTIPKSGPLLGKKKRQRKGCDTQAIYTGESRKD